MSTTAIAMAALVGVLPRATPSQDLRPLAVDSACACVMVLERVATLGNLDDSLSLSVRTVIARDSRGRFYLAPVSPRGVVAIAQPSGQFIGTIGRAGSGPGDLGSVRHVRVGPGDVIYVLDQARLTTFSPAGAFVRTSLLPSGLSAFRFVILGDSRIVLNNYSYTRQNLTLMSAQLGETRTFGRSIDGQTFPDPDAMQVFLAAIDSGRFVSVQQNHRFLIQIWDTNGVMRRQLQRSPPWFPPWSREQRLAQGPRSLPLPAMMGVYVDTIRRKVWVTAAVPDRSRRGVRERGAQRGVREVPGSIGMSLADFPSIFDTIVEVIDWDSGKVEVSQRFDSYVPYLMEGGLLYGLREDSSGVYVAEVYRPRFELKR